MLKSLSGRFLVLTIFFNAGRSDYFYAFYRKFRAGFLIEGIERAQIASLALLADDMISREL